MVCGVWWYQNFAYICRASEAVVSARGFTLRSPSRHHCAWVTFSERGGFGFLTLFFICTKASVKASAVNGSPSANR
nr:MAG TPA: hypothetical protein [Caudoviricetes sp.]